MGRGNKKEAVAKQLRAARDAQGISQNKLALITELHPDTIFKAEKAGVVSWRTAKRLGEVFGLDPDDLITTPERE